MLTLQVGDDPRHLDFAQGAILIGRSSSCDVVLDDRRVSRQHARIETTGEQVRLVDLGSGNGTLVNGRKVRSELLMTGDVLQIGRTHLTVMRLRTPARSEAVASNPTEDEFVEAVLPSVARSATDLPRVPESAPPSGTGKGGSPRLANA